MFAYSSAPRREAPPPGPPRPLRTPVPCFGPDVAGVRAESAPISKPLFKQEFNLSKTRRKLLEAVQAGNLTNVESRLFEIFKYRESEFGKVFESAAVEAANLGQIAIVEFLLAWEYRNGQGAISPSALEKIIAAAAKGGKLDVVQLLLKQPRLVEAVKHAAGEGHVEVLQLLLSDWQATSDDLKRAFLAAVENDQTEIMKMMLANERFDPELLANDAVREAAFSNSTAALALLLADDRFDPAADNNAAVRHAASSGSKEALALLLEDERVDPGAMEDDAILRAVEGDHADVVTMLLGDTRVNPAAKEDQALRLAAYHGYDDVVELLLKDPRVNPGANDNEVMRSAIRKGEEWLVKELLEDSRVIFTNDQLEEYIAMAEDKQKRFVADQLREELLQREEQVPADADLEKPDPSAAVQAEFLLAAVTNKFRRVAEMLKDPGVDPTADGNSPLREAVARGHVPVVSLLLADPRVIISDVQFHEFIGLAESGGRNDVAEMLRTKWRQVKLQEPADADVAGPSS